MTTSTAERGSNLGISKLAVAGAIAGLAGGVVFGMMMAMMGMLPMIGMLVGQQNAYVGLVVHLGISTFIGAVYGVIAGRYAQIAGRAAIGGIVNGLVWWVLGALFLMPLILGMSQMIFVVQQAQLLSLVGHLVYGLVTAFVFISLSKRI
jgi:uncharacterized membrane protein YagU involved in acid resistance